MNEPQNATTSAAGLLPGREQALLEPGRATAPVFEHCVYSSFEAARPLREAWDDLAARAGDLFASPDWCEVWWQHYGQRRRLQIHVVHEGPDLVAVVPLFSQTLRPLGVPLRVVRLVGCDHALTPAGMAIRPDRVRPVIDRVIGALERQGHWDMLHLGPLQCYVDTIEAMAEAFAGLPTVGEVITGMRDNCMTVYDIPGTYEQYLAGLAGSERRNVLRCERNVAVDRQVRPGVPDTPEEIREAMAALVRLHQGLWTGKGKLGQFKDWPDYERFHAAMAERHMQTGRLALVTLRAGEQIVGVEYGYHFGTRTHALIRGYCDGPEWRSYSIGRMLHCHVVQQAIARGSVLMDDGRGAFEYKRRLGGQLRCERSLTIVRRGAASRLRTWLAMRAAWCVHAVYDRIWFDWLRPKLRLPARPLQRSYIRMSFLGHLFKRTHFSLTGGPRVGHAVCTHTEALCPLAGRAETDASAKPDAGTQAAPLHKCGSSCSDARLDKSAGTPR